MGRRGNSSGGLSVVNRRGILDEEITSRRAAQFGTGNRFDQMIERFRGPWFHVSYYLPPPVTEISWTAAGPVRPEMHQRHGGYRRWAGADSQSNEGMHSNGPAGVSVTNAALMAKIKMQPPVQNPITIPRYRGQSYSQTTRVNG